MPKWNLIKIYFPLKAPHSFFAVRNKRQDFSITLGGHFEQWTHAQKYKNITLTGLNGALIYGIWAEIGG